MSPIPISPLLVCSLPIQQNTGSHHLPTILFNCLILVYITEGMELFIVLLCGSNIVQSAQQLENK